MRSARFERAYAAHYEPIFAYVLRRTDSVQDASDVVADVFLTAWRRVDDMPDDEETVLWLYGIARRVLANHARSRRRYDRLAARVLATGTTSTATEARDPDGAVAAAFDRLRPEDQDILGLVAVEGLTPTEIARALGRPAVYVRVRLHRARSRFARELNAEGIEM
ncbi:RNA polymerase sigma factor [Dactylosporangium sp. NPDC000521]|uniref:RNA polymerase sigma factor n=1 Tax=Dactylosporangium sp. NPDC000521 TaxID=3363975 RepID=UPI00367C783D